MLCALQERGERFRAVLALVEAGELSEAQLEPRLHLQRPEQKEDSGVEEEVARGRIAVLVECLKSIQRSDAAPSPQR